MESLFGEIDDHIENLLADDNSKTKKLREGLKAFRKIKAIENFDHLIVGPIERKFSDQPDFRILVLPDHSTPIELRTHTADPVPFAWCGQGIPRDEAQVFSELSAARSNLRVNNGYKLIEHFING